MHTLIRLGTHAAAVTSLILPAAVSSPATAAAEGGGTTVVFDNYLRRCDFSKVSIAPKVPSPMLGTGSAVVRVNGSTAVAEVHLVDAPEPGMHFDVGLIEEPRPSSAGCGPATREPLSPVWTSTARAAARRPFPTPSGPAPPGYG
ncbi:hypothetical protein I549_0173 [Mycobacterium avium subsp. avium 2285 (R)]|nr:hypothetical protein I549_0173 [Mycobacterium avium subsp. avium 2285 (R)]